MLQTNLLSPPARVIICRVGVPMEPTLQCQDREPNNKQQTNNKRKLTRPGMMLVMALGVIAACHTGCADAGGKFSLYFKLHRRMNPLSPSRHPITTHSPMFPRPPDPVSSAFCCVAHRAWGRASVSPPAAPQSDTRLV